MSGEEVIGFIIVLFALGGVWLREVRQTPGIW